MENKGLLYNLNAKHAAKFVPLFDAGVRKFDYLGGRRSGKTFFICQALLQRVLHQNDEVSVATMTSEQGRLGAYADCVRILDGTPNADYYFEILKSPRQINSKHGKGRMFFNSYQDPERAKGIACDWLYINEANNFTEQQYMDLSASVRKGVFADRNPNTQCWTETNGFSLIHSTWRDNDYLTDEQRKWFAMLKQKAESPTATVADVAFYKMYYLGEYAEIQGEIFTPSNIQRTDTAPAGLRHYMIFADPSALRGNDYFACVLTATDGATMYVLDTLSLNDGGQAARVEIVRKIRQWCAEYDIERIYIETNGEIGITFYEFAQNSNLAVDGWNSKGNKYQRIMADYNGITEQVVFVNNERTDGFLLQVFEFGEKCEHDDNIDAVNSAYLAHKYSGTLFLQGV